jgi:hypothetical protein
MSHDTPDAPDALNHYLDGNPHEFPNRDPAMVEFRLLWLTWLASWGRRRQDRWRRHLLQCRMDELRVDIARGPGPFWQEFAETLPGYVEFWNNH